MHATLRTPLLVLLGLCALSTQADDALTPQAHVWTVGDMLRVEYSTKTQIQEREGGEDYDAKDTLRLVFVDRIDRLQDGKVTAVSRHFVTARMTQDGEEFDSLGLEGRTVKLLHSGKSVGEAAWASGGRVTGEAARIARHAPWPDLAATYRVSQGSRQGSLDKTDLSTWSPAEVPPFVIRHANESGLPTIQSGKWELKVKGEFKPAGQLSVTASFQGTAGEEGDSPYEQKRTVEFTLVCAAYSKAFPVDAAPPTEPEADEGDDDGDFDEYEPEPDGEDEDDPLPEDEDDDEGY